MKHVSKAEWVQSVLMAAPAFCLLATGAAMLRQVDPIQTDLERMHKVATATLLYCADNDSTVPPSHYNGAIGNYANSELWGTLVFPYHGDWLAYRCSSDPHANDQELGYDAYGVQCQSTEECHWDWALRTNRGYNWQYLSTWWYDSGHSFLSVVKLSQISSLGKTIAFTDSIWNRDHRGNPSGGGNWVVDPPAIFDSNLEDTRTGGYPGEGYWNLGGWNPRKPLAWNVYGGAFTWHVLKSKPVPGMSSGYIVPTVMVDGSAKALTITQLEAGAIVKDAFYGVIFDREKYLWDLQ